MIEGEPETPAAEVARLLQQVSSYAGPATEAVGTNALYAAFVAGGALKKCVSSFQVGFLLCLTPTRARVVHEKVLLFPLKDFVS